MTSQGSVSNTPLVLHDLKIIVSLNKIPSSPPIISTPHASSWQSETGTKKINFQLVIFDEIQAREDAMSYFVGDKVVYDKTSESLLILLSSNQEESNNELSMVVIDGSFTLSDEVPVNTKIYFQYPQYPPGISPNPTITKRGTISVPKSVSIPDKK